MKAVDLARNKPRLFVKSYGYGIMSVEVVPAPIVREKPNGDKSALEQEVGKMVQRSGIIFSEIVSDLEDSSRAFILSNEGHVPTKYELGQISDEDWDRIRNSIDLSGSQNFSTRLTMLEEKRSEPSGIQAG